MAVLTSVPPTGVEPAHPPPEGGALSTELRGLTLYFLFTISYIRGLHSESPLRVSVKEYSPKNDRPLDELRGGGR
jgi:hypothetical protein